MPEIISSGRASRNIGPFRAVQQNATVNIGATATAGSTAITFEKAFSDPPMVQATARAAGAAFVTNVTATGCTVNLQNTASGAGDIVVSVLAIGPE